MEQIYTIPVNEAFEASAANPSCGCPLCALYRKLEENELELILGASLMEPDVRIQTNRTGFCKIHYDQMRTRKNRLGMALTMESHLDELKKDLTGGLAPAAKAAKRLEALEQTCYICSRIEVHFPKMVDTTVHLWNVDPAFPEKLKAQPYFCLPHYRLLLEVGKKKLPKKKYGDFAAACAAVTEAYLDTLREDVSWFCKKFDYRYDAEPWKNSKDSVDRAILFLRGNIHNP
jgi:hypothetical protein